MHSTVGTAVWHEDAALLDWGFKAIDKVHAGRPAGRPRPAAGTQLSSQRGRRHHHVGRRDHHHHEPRPAGSDHHQGVDRVGQRAQGQLAGGLSVAVPITVAGVLVAEPSGRVDRRVQ